MWSCSGFISPAPLNPAGDAASGRRGHQTGGALYLDSENPAQPGEGLGGASACVSSPLGRVGAVQGFAAHAFHGGFGISSLIESFRHPLVDTGW